MQHTVNKTVRKKGKKKKVRKSGKTVKLSCIAELQAVLCKILSRLCYYRMIE